MRTLANRNKIFRVKTQDKIKITSFLAKSIDHPYELIHHRYHCFLIALKLLLLAQKILPEIRIPGYYSYCHLKKNVSEPGTSLFRNTHVYPKFFRLFYYWVSASIFYKFFGIGKSVHILNFSDKMNCKFWRNSPDRGNELYLLVLVVIYFFKEHIFKFLDSWFEEEYFFNIEDEGLGKIGVVDADRFFSKVYDLLRGEGGFSCFGGRIDDRGDIICRSLFEVGSTGVF